MDPWTLQEAHKLARAIRHTIEDYGFTITVGGQLLYDGRSMKSIDLYLLPTAAGLDPRGMVTALSKVWGRPRNQAFSGTVKEPQVPRPQDHIYWTPSATTPGGAADSYITPPPSPFQGTGGQELSNQEIEEALDVVMEAGEDGTEELRRAIRQEEGWSFKDSPISGGIFRYSLRFNRGPDQINVTII